MLEVLLSSRTNICEKEQGRETKTKKQSQILLSDKEYLQIHLELSFFNGTKGLRTVHKLS